MLNNHIYNLMVQIVQENKSLWRIENHYLKDAGNCAKCKEFWTKMIEDKKKHVQDLEDLISAHMQT